MKISIAVALILCCLTQCDGAEYLKRAVPNYGTGTCWWSSAESIIKSRGGDVELVSEVLSSGVGYKNGASLDDIDHYKERGFYEYHVISRLQAYEYVCQKNQAVIANANPWTTREADGTLNTGCHAIVVVDMIQKPVLGWRVIYWDCNDPYRYSEMSWADFAKINILCISIDKR